MNILEISSVSKHFDEVRVLEQVNISVEEGEFFSILGPSGSGKTTILRLIAGFLYPDEGDIKINQKSIKNFPPEKREVNIVFQNLALFPMMNVFENVAFGLKRKKLSKETIKKEVAKMLKKVGLNGFEKRKIDELSGGQKQRVALARSLIMKPKILLLDEPLSALDKKLKEQMMLELKLLQKDFKTTFLYITHDQSEAMIMSNRIAVVNEGKVEQIASPFELYNYPASPFVASFVGENNRFEVKDRNQESVITENGWKILLTSPEKKEILKNRKVSQMFIRPESFVINPKEKEVLKGKVKTILFDGPHTKIFIETEYKDEILVNLKRKINGLKEGDTVSLGIKEDEIRLF